MKMCAISVRTAKQHDTIARTFRVAAARVKAGFSAMANWLPAVRTVLARATGDIAERRGEGCVFVTAVRSVGSVGVHVQPFIGGVESSNGRQSRVGGWVGLALRLVGGEMRCGVWTQPFGSSSLVALNNAIIEKASVLFTSLSSTQGFAIFCDEWMSVCVSVVWVWVRECSLSATYGANNNTVDGEQLFGDTAKRNIEYDWGRLIDGAVSPCTI